MKSEINWNVKQFNEFELLELYKTIQLRINVFVVEQNCPYPELDDKDILGHHVIGEYNDEIIATARILPANVSYSEVSIGRVATAKKFRSQKIGIALMENCMSFINHFYPHQNVRISAQSHLINFYEKFGFKPTGKNYLEDDIPHSEMLFEIN
jgi:ElaA protein